MDPETQQRLSALEMKVELISESINKTKRNQKITTWVAIAVFVLPLLGLLFAVPAMMSSYNSVLGGL